MYRILYIFLVFLFLSCQKNPGEETSNVLRVTPSFSESAPTKTLIDGGNILSKQIGVQITNSAGAALYDNQSGNNNIRLSYGSSWNLENSVYLSSSQAKIFAYYPYSSTAGDLTGTGATVARLINIPATQVMSNQTDYLWASQDKTIPGGSTSIDNSNSNVSLKMNHSLAQVSFVIYKDNYPGAGNLTRIQINDNSTTPGLKINKAITNDLKMGLSDGTISGGESSASLTVTGITNTISLSSDPGTNPVTLDGLKNGYILVVPVSIDDQTKMQFIITIDGIDYSVSPGAGVLNWQQGNQYIYKVKLTRGKLSVTGVTVTPWSGNGNVDLNTEGGVATQPANCYIIAPGSAKTILVGMKGNGSASAIEGGISTTHTAASMGILWTTTAGLVTLSDFNSTDQTVTISTSAGTGNTLIAAYSGAGQTGTILWSWHIWVTNYNPETSSNGTTYTFTNTAGVTNTFMDRDLGSLSTVYAGTTDKNVLYYQFGRKDPFPGGNYSLAGQPITQRSMSYAIQNPLVYIMVNAGFDWCTTSSDFWWMGIGGNATTPGAKTIYDPCPAGWRVPAWKNAASPWAGLLFNNGVFANNGMNWTTPYNAGFWPAYGARSFGTGLLQLVGTYSGHWSATPATSPKVYIFGFDNTTLQATYNDIRAFGFSVRCVRE